MVETLLALALVAFACPVFREPFCWAPTMASFFWATWACEPGRSGRETAVNELQFVSCKESFASLWRQVLTHLWMAHMCLMFMCQLRLTYTSTDNHAFCATVFLLGDFYSDCATFICLLAARSHSTPPDPHPPNVNSQGDIAMLER